MFPCVWKPNETLALVFEILLQKFISNSIKLKRQCTAVIILHNKAATCNKRKWTEIMTTGVPEIKPVIKFHYFLVTKIHYPQQNRSISHSQLKYIQTWPINERNHEMKYCKFCRLGTVSLRNPVNVKRKWWKNLHVRSYIQVIHDSGILFLTKQTRQNLFCCNSTVHLLVIAMRQNVPIEIILWLRLKISLSSCFSGLTKIQSLALQRSRLLPLDDGKDKRFPVVGRRVGVSQQKSFFWNWNQQQVFNSVSQSERWVPCLVPKIDAIFVVSISNCWYAIVAEAAYSCNCSRLINRDSMKFSLCQFTL